MLKMEAGNWIYACDASRERERCITQRKRGRDILHVVVLLQERKKNTDVHSVSQETGLKEEKLNYKNMKTRDR